MANENMQELELNELEQASGGAYKRPSDKNGYIIYQIQKGDTLTRIASHYGCTVKDIQSWNPKITDPRLIYAGDYLYIKR